MGRTARETTSTIDEDFLPSAKGAVYAGDVEVQESDNTPLAVEDEQLETEWYNPTEIDVVLPIHIGTDPKNQAWVRAFNQASPSRRQEMKTGVRTYIVKAKTTRKISSEYDLAIQRTHCLLPSCTARKDACKDLDHPRVVVAGLGPQLVCKRWHKVPAITAALDQARAVAAAAKEQLAQAAAQKIAAETETASAKLQLEEALKLAQEAVASRKAAEAELARIKAEKATK